MSETNTNAAEPTAEELQEYRKKMDQFYDEQTPLLQKQFEYEDLLARIEEARAKRLTMSMRIAQIMAGPKEPSAEELKEMKQAFKEAQEEELAKEPKRKLKDQ